MSDKSKKKSSGKKGKGPQDKKVVPKKATANKKAVSSKNGSNGSFGISIADIFTTGFKGYFNNIVILTLAALPVFIVFTVASTPWRSFNSELQDRVDADPESTLAILEQLQWVGLLLVASFPAGVIAAPWFRYALDVVDEKEINVMAPLIDGQKWLNHAFATFWFWAGITLGLRYSVLIPGLPSIIVLLLYPFYGYIIAGGREINGLKALGVSVRLGVGKRLGLFAIAGLMFMFNIFGVLGFAVGLEDGTPSILGVVLGILGISATASITLVSGGAIYRTLEGNLHG